MFDIKNEDGYLVTGAAIAGKSVYRLDVWNSWDSMALYKSIYRLPDESNSALRKRILMAKDYNSTKQGLINAISDALMVEKYNTVNKKIFKSIHVPLSYMKYKEINKPSLEYYPPRVIVDQVTITFPVDDLDNSGIDKVGANYKYNHEYTQVSGSSYTWTLWKNIDQSYFQIWQCEQVPVFVGLKYMTLIDGELIIVEEVRNDLTRVDGGPVLVEE